jgi:hypothetical protein
VDSGQWTVDVSVRFLQVVHRQALLDGEPVDAAGGVLTWEEAVEREVGPGPFAIDAGSEREELGDGLAVVRSWHALAGSVGVEGRRVTIRNATEWAGDTREQALEHAFCSLHAVMRAERFEEDGRGGEGLWPVLVEDGVVLASPIILEDRPKVAPESPGDLFDGGEIDELLVLNILSLTDEEKAEMRATDPRAREILERTEGLSQDQLLRLHGRLVR